MRRYSLFLMLLCMHCIARGQTGFDYRYWFDNDYRTVYTGHSSTGQWQMEADLDGLSESLHAIHLQVVDAKGVESAPVTRFFLKVRDTSVNQGYYWFDGDRTAQQQMGQVQGMFTIDVSQIADGFHTFYYQVVGKDGSLSSIVSRSFYKVVMPEYARFRCWVDEDLTTMTTGKYTGAPVLVDISHLSEGYHVMRVQVEGVTPSAVVSRPFVKIPQTEGVEYLKCLCVVDDKLFREENVSSTGGVIDWNLDVSGLPQGFHHMQVQVITPSGAATGTYNAYFLRTTTTSEMADMKCVYAIDGAEFNTEAGSMTNGVFHCDLDVSHLEDGLHRIAYKLTNGKGVETKTQTQFFMKTPLGGNGIKEYWYWLNDSTDQVSKVQLAERTNPFKLISLLPVPKHPISSKLFHFELSDGQPMVYAKNNFHIRFYDAAGRFTDESAQFTDYSVKQEVTDAEWLEPGVRATTAKPGENTIKWYCLEAEPGDSLQFKLDRAATIQLFAPSGDEVYSASGSEVVKLNGCHVKEKGTYYLALHDVTATQGNTISIDYSMIGKYALLAYTPNRFSANGTTIMYLNGNGLTYVKSIELVNGDEVLYPDTIVANTTDLLARFALNTDIETAKTYTLNVVFNNEEENDSRTITRRNAITLEPTNKGDIAISIETERRVGDPYPIKVTMKNTGNVGFYGIPLDVAFDNPDKLDEFRFVNFDLLLSDSLYNNREFFTYTDNLVGTGKKGFFMPIVVPYLAPYEEKTLIFGVKTRIAHAKFNFFAWAGTPMFEGVAKTISSSRRKAPPCNPSNIPDVYDALGNADNLTNMPISPSRVLRPFIGAAEAIAGIIQGSTRAREEALFDAYGIPESERDNYRFQYRNCVRSPYDIARDAHPFQARRRAASSGGGSAIDNHASSDCPNPDPHGTDVYIPGDPNEITGYLAESGSHYITGDIKTVCYDIEFENDPELANSSAHSIVIEDQLDSSVFDLSSFTPKDVTISNKKVELSGEQSFVTTLDLRTAINVIAELRCDYNSNTGKIKWTMTSLDPMSMEPTDDIMQGILPINNGNGDGIGHVTYSVNLLDGLAHGTPVNNKASIVFDSNDAIETPVWNNTVDLVAPESHVTDVKMLNDSTATVSIEAIDELSGPWRYDVYVQYSSGAWFKAAENVPIDTTASVKVYEGIDHGFYVIVTDSAGNMEQKEAAREFTLDVFGSQIETNTKIQLAEGWNWMSHNQNTALTAEAVKPKAQRIMSQTEELYKDSKFGWMGDLDELLPTQMYKVQMTEASEVQLSGLLFNAAFRSIPLLAGWNWIGYPVANTMAVSEAMAKFEAEEGDALIGHDGLATFTDGQWTGTLTEMTPGRGYMYRSMSDKNLFLNATAQASSRRSNAKFTIHNAQLPEGWTVDKSRYPSVMGVMAELRQKGEIADADEWLLAAFCGDECRGIAQTVNGVLMINVLGHNGEAITFRALHRESGEIVAISEQEPFRADLLGSMRQPYQLTMGELTGISEIEMLRKGGNEDVYDMQGRKVDADHTAKGVYIVTDGKNSGTQKVVKK